MENIITSLCPSINDLIEIYYPQLIPYVAQVDPPSIAHAKLIKAEDPDARVVFIGPVWRRSGSTSAAGTRGS